MLKFKKWLPLLLITILTLSSLALTGTQASAAKKPSKPKVKVVGSTLIIEPVGTKKKDTVSYTFYTFYKGIWEEAGGVTYPGEGLMGQDILYANIKRNGKHAVSISVNEGRESSLSSFTVTKSKGKANYFSSFELEPDIFHTNYGYRQQTKQRNKIAIWADEHAYNVKNLKIKLYGVDSKGKLKLIGTKKTTEQKEDGFYTAFFPKEKGYRTYVATTVINGKESKHLHIGLAKDEIQIQAQFKGDAFKK